MARARRAGRRVRSSRKVLDEPQPRAPPCGRGSISNSSASERMIAIPSPPSLSSSVSASRRAPARSPRRRRSTSIDEPVVVRARRRSRPPPSPSSYAWRTEFEQASVSASLRSASVSSVSGRSRGEPGQGEPAERDVLGLRRDGQPDGVCGLVGGRMSGSSRRRRVGLRIRHFEPPASGRAASPGAVAGAMRDRGAAPHREDRSRGRPSDPSVRAGWWPMSAATSSALRIGLAVDRRRSRRRSGDPRAPLKALVARPARRPARSAGLSGSTRRPARPQRRQKWRWRASVGVRSLGLDPDVRVAHRVRARSAARIERRAASIGTAKPTPSRRRCRCGSAR